MRKIIILLLIFYSNWSIGQNTVHPSFKIDINDDVNTTQEKSLDATDIFTVTFNASATYIISKTEVAFDNNSDDWFSYEQEKQYQMKGHDFIKFRITCTKKQSEAETTAKKALETKTFTVIFRSNAAIIGADTLHNSSFFVASFVKSIAGNTIPDNELLDLFLKLNFGKSKRFFSLMGVEAGLSAVAKDGNKQPFRINEAMTNMNWAFFGGGKYFKVNPYNSDIELQEEKIKNAQEEVNTIKTTITQKKLDKDAQNKIISDANNAIEKLNADAKSKTEDKEAKNNIIKAANEQIATIEKEIKEATDKLNLQNKVIKKAEFDKVSIIEAQDKKIKTQKVKYWNDTLSRTGFLGAGLKVFNAQTYIGGHIGVMEMNGPLLGSYFMAGIYVTPYNTDSTLKAARGAGVNTFRNNVYIEAAVNAFGKNVPNFLKTIRLKFGLMLPIGKNMDGETSNSGDVLSRLAVEVPLGGVFKF